tara:strand:+ start:509 stop:727 length:219 start_codon:yes stop_codon:yes gene_type:complete
MDLYLVIQSTDFNGDGYFQEFILGIYEDGDAAKQVLHKLIKEHEAEEPHCQADIDTEYFIKEMPLIPAKVIQ